MSQDVVIRIGAVGDPPLFPELADKIEFESEISHVSILEKGMTSGATSAAFYFQLPSGKLAFAQISAGMVIAIASVVKGAVERFEGK